MWWVKCGVTPNLVEFRMWLECQIVKNVYFQWRRDLVVEKWETSAIMKGVVMHLWSIGYEGFHIWNVDVTGWRLEHLSFVVQAKGQMGSAEVRQWNPKIVDISRKGKEVDAIHGIRVTSLEWELVTWFWIRRKVAGEVKTKCLKVELSLLLVWWHRTHT